MSLAISVREPCIATCSGALVIVMWPELRYGNVIKVMIIWLWYRCPRNLDLYQVSCNVIDHSWYGLSQWDYATPSFIGPAHNRNGLWKLMGWFTDERTINISMMFCHLIRRRRQYKANGINLRIQSLQYFYAAKWCCLGRVISRNNKACSKNYMRRVSSPLWFHREVPVSDHWFCKFVKVDFGIWKSVMKCKSTDNFSHLTSCGAGDGIFRLGDQYHSCRCHDSQSHQCISRHAV